MLRWLLAWRLLLLLLLVASVEGGPLPPPLKNHVRDGATRQHTLTQIPQPMHSSSEIHASLLALVTSMHSLPAHTDTHTHHAHEGDMAVSTQPQLQVGWAARLRCSQLLCRTPVHTCPLLTDFDNRAALLALLPALLGLAPAHRQRSGWGQPQQPATAANPHARAPGSC